MFLFGETFGSVVAVANNVRESQFLQLASMSH